MKIYLNAHEYIKRTYMYDFNDEALSRLNEYLSEFYAKDGEQAITTLSMMEAAYLGEWDMDSPLEKKYKRNGETYYFTLGDIIQSYLIDEVWSGELIDEDVKEIYDTDYYVKE